MHPAQRDFGGEETINDFSSHRAIQKETVRTSWFNRSGASPVNEKSAMPVARTSPRFINSPVWRLHSTDRAKIAVRPVLREGCVKP